MMSLLTSYYGIESSPTATKTAPKDQIDAAGFDHTQYVKVKAFFSNFKIMDNTRIC